MKIGVNNFLFFQKNEENSSWRFAQLELWIFIVEKGKQDQLVKIKWQHCKDGSDDDHKHPAVMNFSFFASLICGGGLTFNEKSSMIIIYRF